MQARTKFFLGLFPAVMLIIVAEATIPALIASLAVWTIGLDGFQAGGMYFVFWVATFIAILTMSIYAIGAVGVEMGVINPQEDGKVRPMQNIASVIPIRRGPN